MPIICIIVLWLLWKYVKKSKEKQQESDRLEENFKRQKEYAAELAEVHKILNSSSIIERCLEIIAAYRQLAAIEFFDMSIGNIWVVIPEPEYETIMGKRFASDKEIEIIFDAFYDCSQLPGMLNRGMQSLVS